MLGPLLLAAAALTIREEPYVLRESCVAGSAVVATLHRGDPVHILFSLSDSGETCYKISVDARGLTVEGSVPAGALAGLEEFERGVRTASSANSVKVTGQFEAPSKRVRPKDNPAILEASRLIERNQPNKALEILEHTLKTGWRDPQALVLAGIASYRNHSPRQAMDFWRESLALEANPEVETLYRNVENAQKH